MKRFNMNALDLLPEFESIFGNEFESLYPELEFETKPVNVSKDSEPYIKWVQESLNKILNLKLLVDGDNGKNTRDAIKLFQSKNGLQQLGYVGPKTEAALIKANTLIASAGTTTSAISTSTTTSSTCTSARALPSTISSLLAAIDAMLKKIPLLGYSGIVTPKIARFLTCNEEAIANSVFGNSLDYSRIIITNGLGFSGRPFTIAIPIAGKYYVIMMLGNLPSSGTLIHELTHAWQSQHHGTNPQAFIKGAVNCQLNAAADSILAKATAFSVAFTRIMPSFISPDPFVVKNAINAGYAASANEDTCAYAYIPGKDFDKYGAEQIAQQVEDDYLGTRLNTIITNIIKSVAINTRSIENEVSLSIIRFERKSAPNVEWGACL